MSADFPSDLLSLLDHAGLDPLSFAWGKLAEEERKKRLAAAREAIQRRMKSGATWAHRQDSFASLLFDYLRAAEQGAGRRNLDLMAQMLAHGLDGLGLTEEETRNTLKAVGELSGDELKFVTAYLQEWRAEGEPAPGEDAHAPVSRAWLSLQKRLQTEAKWEPAYIVEVAAAAQRVGLVYPLSGYGGIVFAPAARLRRLGKLLEWPEPS